MSRASSGKRVAPRRNSALLAALAWLLPLAAMGHSIAESDAGFVTGADGPAVIPFIYLGAKHMITGYDHLLFLAGVIFFLYRPVQILKYVTLFALGHSITLILGVLADLRVSAYLVDALIGLSIVYKALDNMGGFQALGRYRPDTRAAVFLFGLCHGFGLATSLQELELSPDGLLINLISFNIGVELGQMLALCAILIVFSLWRTRESYLKYAFISNAVLMACGFLLTGYQLGGWILSN